MASDRQSASSAQMTTYYSPIAICDVRAQANAPPSIRKRIYVRKRDLKTN